MATTALLGIQFAATLVAIFSDDPKVITIGTLGLLPNTALCGASGTVFAFIVMASLDIS